MVCMVYDDDSNENCNDDDDDDDDNNNNNNNNDNNNNGNDGYDDAQSFCQLRPLGEGRRGTEKKTDLKLGNRNDQKDMLSEIIARCATGH
ncbi:unnamed protein product [Porites lobata]|uniref:Uncharacterized protein n=1 Tax=Porites lobata TaxID=104759 RepID=A0ABN8RSJ7_9CNID|nr:unnamed protein product [Porites lobata]